MALFGFSKDKKGEPSSDLVLAYLEEALRRRTPFLLFDGKDRETAATLASIDEAAGTATFQYQGKLAAEKGAKVTPVFILDGLRIGSPCKCAGVRPGQVDLTLPDELAVLERRKHARARLNPKEGATLTALSGLFEGVGMTGVIENISEGGARFRVERAMEAKGEKKLSPHANLVPKGHSFDLIKVSKLPKIPGKYECPGKAAYLDGSGNGLVVGVSFSGFPAEALGALRSLVSSRATATSSTLPPKTRRSQEPEAPPERRERAAPPEPAPPAPEPVAQPAAQAPPPAPPPAEGPPQPEVPAPAPAPPPAEAPAPRNLALTRLKKRSRGILVALPPDDDPAASPVPYLLGEGYGKVLAAGTLGELLGALEEPGLNLLIIDGGVVEREGIDLVETLHRVRHELPPVLLALEAPSADDVLAARELEVAHLMVKPFPLDEDFSRLVEGLLGL